jgi:autotransporter-associated beta strand protein
MSDQDATWLADPVSDDWDAADNWSADSVPTDTAFFASSSDTAITFSSAITSVNAIEFSPGASTYSFSLVGSSSSTPSMSITGDGIISSAGASVFDVTLATLNFSNSSSAGDINITTSGLITDAGLTYTNELQFLNASTAASASITDDAGGVTEFQGNSTAASASITNQFDVFFVDSSSAGSAVIDNAGTTITINGNPVDTNGATGFFDTASAGNATITNYNLGHTIFENGSTAGNATIINYNGGATIFVDDSLGGQARFINNAGGSFDISGASLGISVGSIEGAGSFFLGSNALSVGLNDLNTEVSGAIQDGGADGGTGGSLTKVGSGTLTLSGANTYTGTTTVESGTLLVDGFNADSTVTVANGATLAGTGSAGAVTVESGGTFAPGDPSTFTVASLTLNSGATFDEQIGGTSPGTGGAGGYDQTVVESGGAISLGGATLDVSLVDGFTPTAGETFTIINNETGTPVSGTFNGLAQGATFALDGDLFQISYDGGSSGRDVVLTDEGTAPCYCPGTLIRTACGNKPVEKLQIGDTVMTAAGVARPIKWIGRRSYLGRFVMGRKDILPICIKAGALEDNVPKRDLWISPNHAMYLDGVLIEAKDLVNGVSIVRAESVEQVEYFHIELETHDLIIAEGALSESFIDDDSRGMFHNAREYREVYPAAVTPLAHYCAPRLDSGYELETIRRRIALRAGLTSNEETMPGELRGYLDRVTPNVVEGWAQNVEHPEAPVCLDIYAGGRLIGQVLANRHRDDLKRAGIGSGAHSFLFRTLPGTVSATDQVEVRRSLDGKALPRSAQAKRVRKSIAA